MKICIVLFALGLSALPALGQTGTVTGTVTDSSGGIVGGARVTVANRDTAVVAWKGVSSSSGDYVAPDLPVGIYTITAEQSGFKKTNIENVSLAVNQRVQVNPVLSPGEVAESVTVGADVASIRVESSDSSVSALISPSEVNDLPLPNRDPMALLALVPGMTTGATPTTVATHQLSINGSRTLNTEVTLDGTSLIENVTGQISPMPSPDALQEFRVMTSAYSAESGRTSGGTIAVVIKSGTNLFHGGIYELFRNEDLDANNFFNNNRGIHRPQDRYNQFGGMIGGPVLLPKLYNGRNKTFFFFNYDLTVSRSTSIPTNTVPSAEFKSGNFSSATILVYDPLSGSPFPSNIIPTTRIDPAAAKVMSYLPLSNTIGSADPQNSRVINNYIDPQTLTGTTPKYTGRLDHSFGEKDRIFGSINSWATNTPSALTFSNVLNSVATGYHNGYEASTGWTHMISPTFVAELRFGFNRWDEFGVFPANGTNVEQTLGIASSPAPLPPSMSITSWAAMGPAAGAVKDNYSNTFILNASATKVFSSHTTKFGFTFRKNQFNTFSPASYYMGQYAFGGSITNKGGVGGNAIDSLADFLLGDITSAQYEIPQPLTGRRNYNLGAFVQDDWKVNSKLTVNIGLRWDYEAPLTVVNNIYSRFDPVSGKLLVAGQNASPTLDLTTSKHDFQPRIGFAYAVNPKTVFRTAFGVFFSQVISNLGSSVNYPGYDIIQTFPQPATAKALPFSLSQGMPLAGVQDLNNPSAVLKNATISSPANAGVEFSDLNPIPSVLQWNFGVQREVASGTVVEANYIGNRGTHLPLFISANQPPFNQGTQIANAGGTAQQQARPFPLIGAISGLYDSGNSTYHALQVRAQRQFSTSLGFQLAYTWSKSIDDGSGIFNFSMPNGLVNGQFPLYYRNLDRSVSAFDVPQSVAVALQYRTRGPKWVRDLQFSPILSSQIGKSLTITQSSEYPGVGTQRPNVIAANGNVQLPNWYSNGPGIQYLELPTAAGFPLAPSGPIFSGSGASRIQIASSAIGSLGRYTQRAPGNTTLNLSVARRFQLTERLSLQLRMDAFNALNHTNFSSPSTALTVAAVNNQAVFNSPGFGLITGAAGARFLQIVTRINF